MPGLYLIQTDAEGERRFSCWRDAAPVRQLFDGSVALPRAAFAAAGTRVVFDTNFWPRGWPDPAEARRAFDRMIGASDLVFAGVEDFVLLDGASDPGCITLLHGRHSHVPVPAVLAPLDTTAAGHRLAATVILRPGAIIPRHAMPGPTSDTDVP